MNNPTNEETLPWFDGKPETAPVPRKRATRKTAKSKTSESGENSALPDAVETSVAAPKKAVKKTARKRAGSNPSPLEETTAQSAPTPEPPPPVAKKKTTRTRKAAPEIQTTQETQTPADPTEREPVSADSSRTSPRRIGRVPGGGRVSSQEATNPVPASHQSTNGETVIQLAQSDPEDNSQLPPTLPANQESRSKRRREKRKRRKEQQRQQQGPQPKHPPQGAPQRKPDPEPQARQPVLTGPKTDCNGMLELAPKGFGFLRVAHKNFEQARDDVFVPPEIIRKHNLRVGQWIHGLCQEGQRGSQLVEITSVNDLPADQAAKLPHFDELKAVNPSKRISFETTPERFTTRVLDIMAPVGRGQRGLIVSPPRSGKTTLLLHIAEAIREKYDETLHLMVLLVDERPEEVTEFRRALPGAEIYASSNDEHARSHCRIAELAIERAKRLVEAGKEVFLLMDSITRLARAYNHAMAGNQRGRATGSGGIMIGALEVPRKLFAAARNTRGGGSLTILATALIQTNSRADEAIFMEFKGTGNMELVLDRKIAENYIYPAVDIFKSGTRREELLFPEHMLHKIHLIRRGLSGHRPVEAMERLLFFLKKFPNNPQMLLEIKG